MTEISERKIIQFNRGGKLWAKKREEFLKAISTIPQDTRDLTGRLCGDPLPGRSAMDRKKMGIND